MASLIDEIAGPLNYDHGWCRSERVDFFGQPRAIVLSFGASQPKPIQHVQRNAFARFWQARFQLLSAAESAIREHYDCVRPTLLLQFSENDAAPALPKSPSAGEMGELVTLEEIFFPENFGDDVRVVGLLASCAWDPSLGLAVRFEDEHVVEVGPQDIVL